jgi:hypothetical protein
MFQNGSNKYSGAACRIKEEFLLQRQPTGFPGHGLG